MTELYALMVMVVCVVVVGRYHGILNLVDPVSYFTLTNLVFGFVGIFYRETYRLSAYISDDAATILIGGILAFSVGVLAANQLFGRLATHQSLTLFGVSKRRVDFSFAVTLLVGLLFTCAYVAKTGGVLWLQSGFEDARIDERKGFGWLVLLGLAFVMVGGLYLVIRGLSAKWPKLLVGTLLSVACLLLLMPGNRAPSLELLVAAGFFYCYFRWGRVPLSIFAAGLLIVGALLTVLGVFRSGDAMNLEQALRLAIWRPYVNLQNFQTVFDAFPVYLPFQYGMGLVKDVAVLAPGYQPNFGLWLKEQLNMTFAGGSVTVGFAGEMYANFGSLGVYVGYFLLAFPLVWLSSRLRTFVSEPWLLLRYGISMSAKGIAVSGLVSPFLYTAVPFMLALAFAKLIASVGRTGQGEGVGNA